MSVEAIETIVVIEAIETIVAIVAIEAIKTNSLRAGTVAPPLQR